MRTIEWTGRPFHSTVVVCASSKASESFRTGEACRTR